MKKPIHAFLLIVIFAFILSPGCYTQKLAEPERVIVDIRDTAKITDYYYFRFGELKSVKTRQNNDSKYTDIKIGGIKKRVESVFNDLGYKVLDDWEFKKLTPEEKKEVLTCTCYNYEEKVSEFPEFSNNKISRKRIFIINLYSNDNWIYQSSGEDVILRNKVIGRGDGAVSYALDKIIQDYMDLVK